MTQEYTPANITRVETYKPDGYCMMECLYITSGTKLESMEYIYIYKCLFTSGINEFKTSNIQM